MRSSDSVFIAPDYDVDDRLYFSDISISKEPLMRQYQSLLSQGDYDSALTLIENEDFYGAWLLNLLENRLYNIENKIWSLNKPVLGLYQDTEPTNVEVGMVWIDSGNSFPSADTYPSDSLFPA